MKNRAGLNNFLSQDRKTLYMVLSVLVLSIFTLTMAYAALSTTLNINGNAEVSAASWDIHLDNVQLNSSSATTTAPTITNSTTATFSTALTKPGDFYEFTIDVVNDGSIDAMIDSVTKTPTLTEAQAKYLNYIVEYQNGESINNKQLVSKDSFVKLKVKLEFRKDITASDIPTTSETLNLSFTVNYVQADTTGTNVTDNGIYDPYKVGNEICIGEECFYVISNDEDSVTMLAKYNLYVGGKVVLGGWSAYGEEATGVQDLTMRGYVSGQPISNGTTAFSSSTYWGSVSSGTYVYDNNSTLYNYVENYKTYLESQGAAIEEARLITYDELIALGCVKISHNDRNCLSAPSWVYGTSYWTGAGRNEFVWIVASDGKLDTSGSGYPNNYGVRPVIVLKY